MQQWYAGNDARLALEEALGAKEPATPAAATPAATTQKSVPVDCTFEGLGGDELSRCSDETSSDETSSDASRDKELTPTMAPWKIVRQEGVNFETFHRNFETFHFETSKLSLSISKL